MGAKASVEQFWRRENFLVPAENVLKTPVFETLRDILFGVTETVRRNVSGIVRITLSSKNRMVQLLL